MRVTGGGFVSNKAAVKGYLEDFWYRLSLHKEIIEEEKLDVGYYLAQSWHLVDEEYFRIFKVKFWIDKKLDSGWIKTIKKSLKKIMKYAPGLAFEWKMFDKIPKSKDENQVIWTVNSDDEAYTIGNIFNKKQWTISFWNEWTWHRRGTALHEILHSLGFHHEHSRNDRDKYLKIEMKKTWTTQLKDFLKNWLDLIHLV